MTVAFGSRGSNPLLAHNKRFFNFLRPPPWLPSLEMPN